MSNYNRTTRECSVTQLQPELLQAFRNYFEEHKLGDLETEALMVCETISREKSANTLLSWLDGNSDTTIYIGILLTSQELIWVRQGDRTGTSSNGADLREIQAEFYTTAFSKDNGLEIVGYIGEAKGRVRGRLPMGPDLAAQKFCMEVKEAIKKVKPPAKKGFFGMFGG